MLMQKGFKHKLLFPTGEISLNKVYQLESGKEKQTYSLPQQTIFKDYYLLLNLVSIFLMKI